MKVKELIEILKGHEEAEVWLLGELDEYSLEKEQIEFCTLEYDFPGYDNRDFVYFKCTDEVEEDEEEEDEEDEI